MSNKGNTKYTKDTVAKIKAAHAQGMSYQEMFEKYGVPKGSIGNLLGRRMRAVRSDKGVARKQYTVVPVKEYDTTIPEFKPTEPTFKEVLRTILKSNMGDTMKLLVIDELVGA